MKPWKKTQLLKKNVFAIEIASNMVVYYHALLVVKQHCFAIVFAKCNFRNTEDAVLVAPKQFRNFQLSHKPVINRFLLDVSTAVVVVNG